jgi:hypothetical protein
MATAPASWHVGRVANQCAACNAELPPGTTCWAALCDRPIPDALSPAEKKEAAKTGDDKPEQSPFVRVDFCEKCWADGQRPETLSAQNGTEKLTMFSFWKTLVPAAQQKKKLLVDDSVLVDVFARMEGKTEPQEVRFRFVLALILMRKRLLRYEGVEDAAPDHPASTHPDAPEVWRMIPRGAPDQVVHVINPHLTAEQITEVSGQLSAILAEEL